MLITILGIVSIVIGFLCIAGSYVTVMKKRSRALAIVLGLLALLFVTVVPVTLAVFWATTVSS